MMRLNAWRKRSARIPISCLWRGLDRATPPVARFMGLLLFLLAPTLGSCHAPTVANNCCEGAIDEPLFAVNSVTDMVTGAPVAEVWITNFTRFGSPFLLPQILWRDSNADLVPDGLVCHVPCKFGAEEGDWTMVLRRTGYRDTTLAFHAFYSHVRISGEVQHLSGGITIRVGLTPSANESLHAP